MASFVTPINLTDDALAEHIAQLTEDFQGIRNIPLSVTGINDPTNFSLTLRNAGVGGRGLQVLDSAGAALLTVQDAGVSFSLLASPHMTSPVVDSGGMTITGGSLTLSAGGITLTGGNVTLTAGVLVFGAAASQIIPGASTFSIRNNANSADNLLVTNAGVVTARAGMVVTAGGLIVGGNQPTVAGGQVGIGAVNVALGGGSVATMGTIGAGGPSLAAQQSWWAINIAGVTRFIPLFG